MIAKAIIDIINTNVYAVFFSNKHDSNLVCQGKVIEMHYERVHKTPSSSQKSVRRTVIDIQPTVVYFETPTRLIRTLRIYDDQSLFELKDHKGVIKALFDHKVYSL